MAELNAADADGLEAYRTGPSSHSDGRQGGTDNDNRTRCDVELGDILDAGPGQDVWESGHAVTSATYPLDAQGRQTGPPKSSYSISALPTSTQHYGNEPSGTIGVHWPKEVVRVERDWSGGEVCQFHPSFPMELEGRVTPLQYQQLINSLNHHLILAYSQSSAIFEGILAALTWQTSLMWWTSRFEKELRQVEALIAQANAELWNKQGLNILSPRGVALQFLEIEYY